MQVRSLSGKRITEGAITVTLIDGDNLAILTNAKNEALSVPKDEVNRVIESIRTRTAKYEFKSEGEAAELESQLTALWNRIHHATGHASPMA
ncbi:MAG: hypothetical protein P8Z76_00655 [Alphaproteobacteria bacterium]